jgi:hypothetical protein
VGGRNVKATPDTAFYQYSTDSHSSVSSHMGLQCGKLPSEGRQKKYNTEKELIPAIKMLNCPCEQENT